jgi:hypothetical protein
MAWSKEDVATLKLAACWNDTIEEIAYMLGKDPDLVASKAQELGLRVSHLHDVRHAGQGVSMSTKAYQEGMQP